MTKYKSEPLKSHPYSKVAEVVYLNDATLLLLDGVVSLALDKEDWLHVYCINFGTRPNLKVNMVNDFLKQFNTGLTFTDVNRVFEWGRTCINTHTREMRY